MQVKLSDRHRQVLRATVRQYVATARPVGSGTLLADHPLNVSSATIRNAMGRLEKVGLLYQPHTSAGRIPSDSGYRIYVDELLSPNDAHTHTITQKLAHDLPLAGVSLDTLLRDAAHILSGVSGYIALVTFPNASTLALRHVQLAAVDDQHIMLMIVLESYETDSVLITLPPATHDEDRDTDTLEQELQLLSNFLNYHLRGRSLQDIHTLDWQELGQEFEQYATLLQLSLDGLHKRLQAQPRSGPMVVSGMADVLTRHPEFSELQQIQAILRLLEEEQAQLLPLLFGYGDDGSEAGDAGGTGPATPSTNVLNPNVKVRIGTEIPLEPIQTCTLVSTTYQGGNRCVGSVGILGPTRMLYENAIAFVEATANHLSDALA